MTLPEIGSRWVRPDFDPEKGPFNAYTVVAVTNTAHTHPDHPSQVVYRGDNGHWWSRPVTDWPGSLKPVPDAVAKQA
jgi:hypothetical protein